MIADVLSDTTSVQEAQLFACCHLLCPGVLDGLDSDVVEAEFFEQIGCVQQLGDVIVI